MNNSREDYVFGLDIGTRSIVGTVGYRTGTDRFVVVAQKSLEHTTRAVIDGQIHDIATVADEIASVKKQLEEEKAKYDQQTGYNSNDPVTEQLLDTKTLKDKNGQEYKVY